MTGVSSFGPRDIKEQAGLGMSSTAEKQNRMLFDYYEHHVAGVLWAQCDKESEPERWSIFYRIYRVRQDLDIWDMEKKTWGGEARAEVRRQEIVKWLDELDNFLETTPSTDPLLTFSIGVGSGRKTYSLKPILASLRSEVAPSTLASNLRSLQRHAQGP